MPRTYTQLFYHVVFATKLRIPFITPDLRRDLYPFLGGGVREQGGALISVGGMPDHVHLLAGLRAHPSVADIVKSIKGSSSHWVNDTHRTEDHFAWQEGYAAFTVSKSALSRVQRYIENQEAHHRRQSLSEEMASLFHKHGIDFGNGEPDF
jgi:REP element-mobilizing transposase RayT